MALRSVNARLKLFVDYTNALVVVYRESPCCQYIDSTGNYLRGRNSTAIVNRGETEKLRAIHI